MGINPTDLWVTTTVDKTSAVTGDTLSYTITYGNHGPVPATNITIDDILPIEIASIDLCQTHTGGTCTPNTISGDRHIIITVPTLAVGQTGSFIVN